MFQTINNLQYHLKIEGEGEPLLLLHGFTGSVENWRPLIPHLAKSFTVIAVDLPGHGKTDAPADRERYKMGAVTADLLELMTSLDIEQFNLLGYSMGGRLALFFALAYPTRVKKLVLESASPGLKSSGGRAARRQSDDALAERIERDGIELFIDFWESISLWESQAQLQNASKKTLRGIRLKNSAFGLARSLRGMGTGRQPSLWPQLGELAPSTLLLTGEHDHKFCAIAADMLPKMPGGRHQTILHAGHTVHLEQPAAWLETVIRWFSKK